MMHPSHHSDTLFIISEDDWRLREDEDVMPDRNMPRSGVGADPDEPHASGGDETQLIVPPIADWRQHWSASGPEPPAAHGQRPGSSSDPVSPSPGGVPPETALDAHLEGANMDFYARTSRPRSATASFSQTLTDLSLIHI